MSLSAGSHLLQTARVLQRLADNVPAGRERHHGPMMKPDISLSRIMIFLAGRYARVENFHQLEEEEEPLACAAILDGQNTVVRVNRTREGFEKNAFIARSWPAVGAPRVLSIEPITDAWLCISDKVPGRTLQALGMQAGACGHEIVARLDIMAAIDTSRITGYGRCDASGLEPFPSRQEFMVSVDGPEDLVGFVRTHPLKHVARKWEPVSGDML